MEDLEAEVREARARLVEIESMAYPRRDLVPMSTAQAALMVWRPRRP
jgi:hypothetical protein